MSKEHSESDSFYFTHFWVIQDVQGRHALLGEIGGPPELKGEIKQIAIFLKPYKIMAEKYAGDLNKAMERLAR